MSIQSCTIDWILHFLQRTKKCKIQVISLNMKMNGWMRKCLTAYFLAMNSKRWNRVRTEWVRRLLQFWKIKLGDFVASLNTRGGPRKFRKGWPDTFFTCQLYKYFLYFWEFYEKYCKISKKKGWPGPLRPTPKSALEYSGFSWKLGQNSWGSFIYSLLFEQTPFDISR